MKTLRFLMIALLTISSCIACSAQTSNNETSATNGKIEVFYFHYTHRCATCRAVEDEAKRAVSELYGDKISFASYNLDEADGEAKGKSLEIAGQTLVIVSGDKKIDITNEGFMFARTNPEKLKAVIKEKIDGLL